MGKSSPTPPAAPNPVTVANAQGAANTSTAASQSALNNVNQVSPYGSVSYDQTGSYTNGSGDTVPTYTETTQLSPMEQQLLDQQGGIASGVLNTVANQVPNLNVGQINTNTPQSATLNSTPQTLDQNAANATYDAQKQFLDPQWQQTGQQLQDQLGRQGISVGSDAYNNANTQYDSAKTQAYDSAADNAIASGAQYATNTNNMALQDQQQNIQNQITSQNQPINLLTQLLGGTPNLPTQSTPNAAQSSVSPTDVTGAYALSTNAANQTYQAQLAQQNAMFGGLASLGGAGLLAFA